MTRKLILDVDTGSDDAVAIMLAALHPEIDLLGVTTVDGNAPLEVVVDNTLRAVAVTGRDVPVYRGSSTPSRRPHMPVPRAALPGRAAHALPLPLPRTTASARSEGAVEFLVERALEEPGAIAVVTTAPLTNLAIALEREPRLATALREIVVLGGSHAIGNVTPSAEFNFWADPEAARTVLRSAIRPITLITLDSTHRAPLDRGACAELRAARSPAAEAAALLIERRIATYVDRPEMAERGAAPIHDAVAVAAFVDRALVGTTEVHVDVETSGELTVGRSVIDVDRRSGHSPNVLYATSIRAERFREMLLGVLSAPSP